MKLVPSSEAQITSKSYAIRKSQQPTDPIKKTELPRLDVTKIKIITDQPNPNGVLDFGNYRDVLANIILNSRPQFCIGIIGKWGTGKTTLMRMLERRLRNDKRVLTVWFDPWRYENEDYLAVIPFLRTLSLRLLQTGKRSPWKDLKEAVKDSAVAFLYSTKFTSGLGPVASIETDFEKMVDFFNNKGVFKPDVEALYYDSTRFIENALIKLYDDKGTQDLRIVVFVDDLDRLRPDKALEVLESIKNFFDMEGIIYVLGMNVDNIDQVVNAKYGDTIHVDFDDFLEKYIQVPFRIPNWYQDDLRKYLEDVILAEFKGTSLYEEFLQQLDLLLNIVKPNPRQVKRFVNNIMIAKICYHKPMDELMVVYTLKYGPDEWNRFLEIIAVDDEKRMQFLEIYIKTNNRRTDEFKNAAIEIFPDLAELRKSLDSLFADFLDIPEVVRILLRISKMKEHIRAFDSIYPKMESKDTKSVVANKPDTSRQDTNYTTLGTISPVSTTPTGLNPQELQLPNPLELNPWTGTMYTGYKFIDDYIRKRKLDQEKENQ